MATQTINSSGPYTIACGVASLPTSTGFVSGRESVSVPNNSFLDALVQGSVTTGTGPTADRYINIYVYGSHDTAQRDVLDGSDSQETFASENVRRNFLRLGASILVDATNARTYEFGPFSVAKLFGGLMPAFWGLFVSQDTGQNLHASGPHSFVYSGIKYDVS